MIFRKVFSPDDMPIGAALMPYTGIVYNNVGSPASVTCAAFNDQKWFSGTNAANCFPPSLAGMNLAGVGKTVIGARIYTDSAGKCNYISLYSTNAYFQAIIGTDLGIASYAIAYVECCINWENNTIGWYVNGSTTPAFTKTYTAAQMATIIPTFNTVLIGGNASGGTWWARDISVREYAVGEAYVPFKSLRQGMIQVANVVANGYVASNGATPSGVLNTGYVDISAALTAPTLDTGATLAATPSISADLVLANQFQGNILGLELLDTFKSSEANPGFVNATLTQNGATASAKIAQTAAMQYHKSLFNGLGNAPDGTAWTRAKINSSKLLLTATPG